MTNIMKILINENIRININFIKFSKFNKWFKIKF